MYDLYGCGSVNFNIQFIYREMQCRIVELVGKVNNDEMTAELLRLNDELNNLFLRHQRYEKNRDPKAAQTPSSILGAALGVPASSSTNREKDSLIDFDDDASAANANELNAKFANIGFYQILFHCPANEFNPTYCFRIGYITTISDKQCSCSQWFDSTTDKFNIKGCQRDR